MEQFEDETKSQPLVAVDTMGAQSDAADDDEEIVYVGYVPASHSDTPETDVQEYDAYAEEPDLGPEEPAEAEPEPVEEDDDPFGDEGPRPVTQKIVIGAVIVLVLFGGMYLLDYWGVLHTGIVDIVNSLTGRA